MLLEFLSDEEFRSFIDTKQRLMREELVRGVDVVHQ